MLDNVKRKGRSIIFAIEGTDELRYLNTNQANANVGGELLTHIILREDPREIEVWEEFLHGTQQKCGLIEKYGVDRAEIHVKEFMIKHSRLMKLFGEDVEILKRLLKGP